MDVHANHPYYLSSCMHACIAKDAVQPHRVKGFLRAPLAATLGNFRFDYEYDYEYEIRQAKRMLYAYAIPYTDAKKS
jgi:hypothetical protein